MQQHDQSSMILWRIIQASITFESCKKHNGKVDITNVANILHASHETTYRHKVHEDFPEYAHT